MKVDCKKSNNQTQCLARILYWQQKNSPVNQLIRKNKVTVFFVWFARISLLIGGICLIFHRSVFSVHLLPGLTLLWNLITTLIQLCTMGRLYTLQMSFCILCKTLLCSYFWKIASAFLWHYEAITFVSFYNVCQHHTNVKVEKHWRQVARKGRCEKLPQVHCSGGVDKTWIQAHGLPYGLPYGLPCGPPPKLFFFDKNKK